MSADHGAGRFEGSTGTHRVTAPTPPSPDLQLRFAQALCLNDRFHLYRVGGSNQTEPGLISASDALASRRAYLGETHPWVWAIDADDSESICVRDALAATRALLDANDVEFIETNSGNPTRPGRHIFAYLPAGTEVIRDQIRNELKRLHGPALDFKKSMRPPLAPHRHCGHSVPINEILDDVETVERWYVEQQGEQLARNGRKALPGWAQAIVNGDLELCRRLGKEPKPDRSGREAQIVLACRNSGWTEAEYLQLRGVNGSHPCEKALEKGAGGVEWLQKLWAWAQHQPQPTSQTREGMDRLNEFDVLVDSSADLTRAEKSVLAALILTARQIGKTSFGLDVRTLAENSLLATGTVSKIVTKTGSPIRRFVEITDETTDQNLSDSNTCRQYRLRVLEALNGTGARTEQSVNTGGVLLDCSILAPSLRLHVAFSRQGLKATGYETLKCYSTNEPRTQAEAARNSAKPAVSVRSLKERTKELRSVGLLVEADGAPGRFVRRADFDFDSYAESAGLYGVLYRKQQRHDDQRLDNLRYRHSRGDINEVAFVEGKARLTVKASQRQSVAQKRRDAAVFQPCEVPRSIHGGQIDLVTGEITQPQDTAIQATVLDPFALDAEMELEIRLIVAGWAA